MSVSPNDCFHLTVEIVQEIHAEAIARFGGSDGLREMTLLESAVAAPQASFGGESPYADLVEVAGAYLFYLCRNHPFVDGNKRAAFASIIVFLGLNGIDFDVPPAAATAMILSLAAGEVAEDGLTRWIRDNWPAT
jgi:death-on-curing protein